MNLFEIIGYPLLAVCALEVLLGAVILRNNPRRSPLNRAVAAFSFIAAAFALSTALVYLRASRGADFTFYSRFTWVGWLMIPAAFQIVFHIKEEGGRSTRRAGRFLYPLWTVIFLLCLFTDLVEIGESSLVPFVEQSGPFAKPVRLLGTILVLWAIAEIYRLRTRVSGIRKVQLDYFLHGIVLFAAGGVIVGGILPLAGGPPVDPSLASYFSLPWVCLTWYAATRRRLFHIRHAVSRAVPLAALAALAVGLHLLLIDLLAPALGTTPSVILSLFVIALLAVAAGAVRSVRSWLSRTLAPGKNDYRQALTESIFAIATILDLDQLLGFIVNSMKKHLDVDTAGLYLQSADGSFSLRQGTACRKPVEAPPAPDVDLLRWLGRAGKIAVREELLAEGPDSAFMAGQMEQICAAAAVPLFSRDRMIGVLMLGPKRDGEPFTPLDTDLLEALAGHAAVAVENALLYVKMEEKVRERTRELEEARAAAEAANKAKSEFLSNISHELRTPLNSIIGFSELMRDGAAGPLSGDQAAYLKDIWESGKHLLRIINNILDLSKIEAGMMELEPDQFYLKELLEGSMALFRDRAQRGGLTLSADISEDVDLVIADRTKVKQVALNLLANAVKFTPQGGRVTIAARRIRRPPAGSAGAPAEDGDCIEVSVSDTGIGISPADRERLFQPFRQLGDTMTKKYEGTGLGLHLSRKYVELHGGRIRVESEPGRGSTFRFTLPQTPEQAAQPES